MDDIDNISLDCAKIIINNKTYDVYNWHIENIIISRQDTTREFVATKATPIINLFNKTKTQHLYRYTDLKTKQGGLGYTLRDAKAEADYNISNNFHNRARDEKWNMDTLISLKEYGVISHCCFVGVYEWADREGIDKDKKYKISDFLKIANGTFNHNKFIKFLHETGVLEDINEKI